MKIIQLEAKRKQMDRIDRSLLALLARRQKISSEMGRIKRQYAITLLQPLRRKEVLQSRTQWASRKGLPAWFVARLFRLIMKHSLAVQKRAMGRASKGKC